MMSKKGSSLFGGRARQHEGWGVRVRFSPAPAWRAGAAAPALQRRRRRLGDAEVHRVLGVRPRYAPPSPPASPSQLSGPCRPWSMEGLAARKSEGIQFPFSFSSPGCAEGGSLTLKGFVLSCLCAACPELSRFCRAVYTFVA